MGNPGENTRYFVRLTLSQRIQHILLVISTIVLIITGYMIQAEAIVIESFGTASETIFMWRGWIHRGAGVLGIIACMYHIVYVIVTRDGRSWFIDMIPRPKDALDAYQNIIYMLGFREKRPKMDRFFYLEKLEYWSVWFGMFVVIVTGIMLWSNFLWPKFVLDIASTFHLGEATLATLAIIVGHVYAVHFNAHVYPMNMTFIDGLIDEHLMKEEHMMEYEREMAKDENEEISLMDGEVARLIADYRNAIEFFINLVRGKPKNNDTVDGADSDG
jgi:cytochrome b subunit of formate dehydrogenase